MQSLYIEKQFTYDGSQLRSLFAYLEYRILGPSIISWRGRCSIPFEFMADGEDILSKSLIQGDEMLHFIIEVFDRELFTGVALQRLFASIAKDYLQKNSTFSEAINLVRDGDDIYLFDKKLSISIAAKSPVSVMVHFAMNITNEGTPVRTLCLNELGVAPVKAAEDLMEIFRREYLSIVDATQKVRPLP